MKRNGVALLLAMLLLIVVALPVFAIADPVTPPEASAIYVFEFSDGSIGVYIDYYLDYASPYPGETATESYLASFIDIDGTTQLKTVAPYTYVRSGYTRGAIWIPFTADEVTTYSISSANQALYRVWLMGNPTVPSGWAGDPPKTIIALSDWLDTGDMSLRLAEYVLFYADILELEWSVDLVEMTALGNKLTGNGEDYFENVIPNLRTLAPNCFSAGETTPLLEDLDYSTEFGATITGAIINGAPLYLASGTTVIQALATGNFTATLSQGTTGQIVNGTAIISSSPSALVSGANQIVVTAAPGSLSVTVSATGLQAQQERDVSGTGWDLTTLAAVFGMSRAVFSAGVWIIISVLICGATFAASKRRDAWGGEGAGKVVMLVFGVCIIGGVLLGLVIPKVAALLFISYGGFVGYVLFFKNGTGDVGRTVMFMGYMWLVVCVSGGILQGITPTAITYLTADLTVADTVVTVNSTRGFREPGTLVIGSERIAYFDTTNSTFRGTFWRPLVRGSSDTTAVAHLSGARVRMPETALLNNSLDYNIALLSDASGLQAFVTVPLALFNIITSFMFLPLGFLGTDMVILTVIWGLVVLGTLVTLWIALAGGRRV